MEQQITTSEITQDAAFKKRRSQKNWVVMALIMGGVALVWSVTMIKIQNGMPVGHSIGSSAQETPQKTSEGDSHAQ